MGGIYWDVSPRTNPWHNNKAIISALLLKVRTHILAPCNKAAADSIDNTYGRHNTGRGFFL